MEEKRHPKVFISYSHVDGKYEQQMLDFADRLRRDGIDANIDLYEDAPIEGWPRWMENQITCADYVLVVASESYWKKCYESQAKGISWEVSLVYQMVYDASCKTSKFIPVFWNEGDDKYILKPIKAYTHYNIGKEDGYQDLWKRLLGISKHQRPELGDLDIHKYDPLPKKPRRMMFFATPIDVEKWDAAQWRGMLYMFSYDPHVPPILGFLFRDFDAGKKIFQQWRRDYKTESADDYLKITYIVPPFPKGCYVYSEPEMNYGNGYFIHVGTNEAKAIERASSSKADIESLLVASISRYLWVDEINGSAKRELFFKQVKEFGVFSIVPMALIDESKAVTEENLAVDFEDSVELKEVAFKRGINLDENDQCKVVLMKRC